VPNFVSPLFKSALASSQAMGAQVPLKVSNNAVTSQNRVIGIDSKSEFRIPSVLEMQGLIRANASNSYASTMHEQQKVFLDLMVNLSSGSSDLRFNLQSKYEDLSLSLQKVQSGESSLSDFKIALSEWMNYGQHLLGQVSNMQVDLDQTISTDLISAQRALQSYKDAMKHYKINNDSSSKFEAYKSLMEASAFFDLHINRSNEDIGVGLRNYSILSDYSQFSFAQKSNYNLADEPSSVFIDGYEHKSGSIGLGGSIQGCIDFSVKLKGFKNQINAMFQTSIDLINQELSKINLDGTGDFVVYNDSTPVFEKLNGILSAVDPSLSVSGDSLTASSSVSYDNLNYRRVFSNTIQAGGILELPYMEGGFSGKIDIEVNGVVQTLDLSQKNDSSSTFWFAFGDNPGSSTNQIAANGFAIKASADSNKMQIIAGSQATLKVTPNVGDPPLMNGTAFIEAKDANFNFSQVVQLGSLTLGNLIEVSNVSGLQSGFSFDLNESWIQYLENTPFDGLNLSINPFSGVKNIFDSFGSGNFDFASLNGVVENGLSLKNYLLRMKQDLKTVALADERRAENASLVWKSVQEANAQYEFDFQSSKNQAQEAQRSYEGAMLAKENEDRIMDSLTRLAQG
jgi:hypothetical protein